MALRDDLKSIFGSLERLTFVQIGANDGRVGDPLREMILEHNWTGVLVEPLRHEFRKLMRGYSMEGELLKFANVAVADHDGQVTLWRAARRGDASTIVRERLGDKIRSHAVQTMVPCLTLKTLMHGFSITELDLLQIDTEGYDYEIIKQLDTLSFKPRVIHFECHLLKAEKEPCFEFLTKRGYALGPGASKRDILALL